MTQGSDNSLAPHRLVFGDRVRAFRLAAGMSQEELADRSGIHRTYVSSLERGQRNVGLDNIVALAKALGVEPPALLGNEGA